MKTIELLAPARDLECGTAAIDSGADAVYIGAAHYGARAKAGNDLQDIAALTEYAHRYWARVYVTVNTLLHDRELPQAVRLIEQLYEIGVDAIIIQDLGLYECEIPPIPVIASTQMHNNTPDKVSFLEQVGFQRVILARELSLDQIRDIRAQTSIELEYFVHGALCVCYSGQCYMSYAIGGRSGNRGECAQPCRRRYTLVDAQGNTIAENQHLLSLRDLCLAGDIEDLIQAGVCSFKIEGRLKDRAYVTNVVSHYRRQIDGALKTLRLRRSSSGQSHIGFTPNVDKTFNRGYTDYYLRGGKARPGALRTPKMVGEPIGTVAHVRGPSFELEGDTELHNGDGLTFFAADGTLQGTLVSRTKGRAIFPVKMSGIRPGLALYRNHDHAFLTQLGKSRPRRSMGVWLTLGETEDGLFLSARDEDGNHTTVHAPSTKPLADKAERMRETIDRQLRKTGDTEFVCTEVTVDWREIYFVPISALNALRRDVLAALRLVRQQNRPRFTIAPLRNSVSYPQTDLDYRGNVLNSKARAFYRRHGVEQIEPAAESGIDMHDREVMRTRYCLLNQLGLCRQEAVAKRPQEPLYLVDEDGHRYPLEFDCATCEMHVIY